MYEQSSKWNTYYMELEPERRLAILEELFMTQPDDGANEYRRLLFSRRYEEPRTPGKYVDRMLFQCANLTQIYKSSRIFKRSAKKEIKQIWEDFLFEVAGDYGEPGEKALYWEIRNASARYFKTCLSDSYGRTLFGIMKSGDLNRQEKTCRDAWEMSEGVSARLGEGERMRIWNMAVRDSYFMSDANAKDRWETFIRQVTQK